MDINNRLRLIWDGLASNTCNFDTEIEESDKGYFERRCQAEGAEFYARKLSTLSQSLLDGFNTGKYSCPVDFERKQGTALPQFLFSLWSRVFREEDGELLDDADTGAVFWLRQLTAVFTKIKGGHTPESEVECINRFIANEEYIKNTRIDLNRMIGQAPLRNILESARATLSNVLGGVNPRDIHPQHSSGVSSDSLPPWKRYELPTYVDKIHTYWLYDEYCTLGAAHIADKWYMSLCIPDRGPQRAKVLIVPKNAKGPRIISCEPSPHMFVQQGLMTKLYYVAPRHPLTRQSVYFTDQRPNQRAAMLGSAHHDDNAHPEASATLDCQDASDLIRLDLVQYLFPSEWAEALTRARTEETVLPNGKSVSLRKHAPMGSATCFPVMAYTIWSVLSAALPPRTGSRKTRILVYGDDIVVPVVHAQRAMEVLEAIGLKINRRKSYHTGPFRESCGKEYFAGRDITPVYLRKLPYDTLDSRDALISFANALFAKQGCMQYWLVERLERQFGAIPQIEYDPFGSNQRATFDPDVWVDDWQQSRLRSDPTFVRTISGALWSWFPTNTRVAKRRHPEFPDRVQYKCLVAVPVRVKYPKHDWSQLFRALVNPRREVPLGIDAIANRVSYRWKWVQLYNC